LQIHIHYSVSAIIFVTFCSKNVECLWGVACYVLWSYGLIVFHSEFLLNMPRLSKDQRVWVCLEHARFQNAEEVRRRWPPGRWGNIPAPTKRTISTTYRKFLREATFHDLNKGRSGRPRTARTPENIELVRESLSQHGKDRHDETG
jgi:hypothetical protein